MPNPGQRNFGSNNTSINGPAAPAPSSSEVALWEQFDLAHRFVAQQLDHTIERDHGLNSHGFELLRALASATEKRLWMSDLAVRLGLTRSGVTRLVERLEAGGSVIRLRDDLDRRVVHAQLTTGGEARLEAVAKTYDTTLGELLNGRFSDRELQDLGQALGMPSTMVAARTTTKDGDS